jgi:glycerol-3-phosphate acyltransferase PlsY
LDALLFLILTYLVAAVPFGLLVTMLQGGEIDPRAEGSGNIGATNTARLYGWRVAVRVLLLDAGKGFVPVALAGLLFPELGLWWLGLVAWTAFLGHCFPIYLAFRGGKGVATTAGAMLALVPVPTLAALAVWVVVLRLARRSSVASLVATLALVGLTWLWEPDALGVVAGLGVGIFAMHSGNLRRLLTGKEAPVLPPVRVGRAARVDVDALLQQGPAGGEPPPSLWKSGSNEGELP